MYLQPDDPAAYPEAVKAIEDADLLIIGPGSLYTSVMPNLLVKGIREAILGASAMKVYVCNVATEPGETDDYTVGDHVAALAGNALEAAPQQRHAHFPEALGDVVLGDLAQSTQVAEGVLELAGQTIKHDPKLGPWPTGWKLKLKT